MANMNNPVIENNITSAKHVKESRHIKYNLLVNKKFPNFIDSLIHKN